MTEKQEKIADSASDAHATSVAAIRDRHPRSLQDVVELAHVVRNELWATDDDDSDASTAVPEEAHSINHQLERALLKAALSLKELDVSGRAA